jgi:hypothetical protein
VSKAIETLGRLWGLSDSALEDRLDQIDQCVQNVDGATGGALTKALREANLASDPRTISWLSRSFFAADTPCTWKMSSEEAESYASTIRHCSDYTADTPMGEQLRALMSGLLLEGANQ